MPSVNLTSGLVASATCPPGKRKIVYWDKSVPGFVLELRPNGGTYALRYIDEHGTQRQHRIGTLGVMHFDDARKAARKLRSDVELGGDPAAKKAKKLTIPLYGEVATQHLAHAKTYLRSWKGIESLLRLHILPEWGKVLRTPVIKGAIRRPAPPE